MANCPECHESVPFLEGMPGRGGPHPYYRCWRCTTPSCVPILQAALLWLTVPIFTALIYLALVRTLPPDKQYAFLVLGLFAIPLLLYCVGRFLWMFCIQLERVE